MPNVFQFSKPLQSMKTTQIFGVDWTGVNLYKRLGMKGHNGLDLRAVIGTPVYAAFGGEAYIEVEAPPENPLPGYSSGYGINIVVRNKQLGLEAVYGHLSVTLIKSGDKVSAQQEIAKSGNTGNSSGPHLHFGVRRISYAPSGAGPTYIDYDNGFRGYIDPMPFFTEGAFHLPVDYGYGLPPAKSEVAWYSDAFYFWRTVKRLPTTREKFALLYGRWDIRTVLDETMLDVWTQYSKPAWNARKK